MPSVDALHGRIVWAANVPQAVDRGLAQIPAVAYADTPCYQASGSPWKCDPLHMGECKDVTASSNPGSYNIYIVLLTAREVSQLRANQQTAAAGPISIDFAQALDPVLVTPRYEVPTECPRDS